MAIQSPALTPEVRGARVRVCAEAGGMIEGNAKAGGGSAEAGGREN